MKKVIISGLLLFFIQNLLADEIKIDEVIVSATGQQEKLVDLPIAGFKMNKPDLEDTQMRSFSDVLRRVPGTQTMTNNGDNNIISIRGPFTVSPFNVYAEDGLPVRSSGFFNLNASATINTFQSGGIEIIKGPTSILYGSDAIGGVINVLSRPATKNEFKGSVEHGSYGFTRTLLTGGIVGDDWGISPSINITEDGGYKDSSNISNKYFNLRADKFLNSDSSIKFLASYSDLHHQLSGGSRLREYDYINNPRYNYVPISFRDEQSFRLSANYEKQTEKAYLSVMPYVRYNNFQIIPTFIMLNQLSIQEERNYSYGILSKYHRDFDPMKSRLILGLDIDRSPGWAKETAISTTSEVLPSGASRYTSYTKTGVMNYDYNVTFTSISPYVQGEFEPIKSIPLRLSMGLRYDHLVFDYNNNLSAVTTNCSVVNGQKCRPGDASPEFNNISPKLGAVYKLNDKNNLYANYSEGFRAPAQFQLFQQGSSYNTIDLKPVTAKNYEIGLKGEVLRDVNYSMNYFELYKENDVLAYKSPIDGTTAQTNNGTTSHKGTEIGLYTKLTDDLKLDIAASYIEHRYDNWIIGSIDYSGHRIEMTPRVMSNVFLTYSPSYFKGGKISGEWYHSGETAIDQANTAKYGGHDIFNLYANYPVNKSIEIFGKITNVTDKKYSEYMAVTSAGREFQVAQPRMMYIGLSYKWGPSKE